MTTETYQWPWGYMIAQQDDSNIWILEAMATGPIEFVQLWKSIEKLIDQHPHKAVQVYVDPTQPKLLDLFFGNPLFEVEFVSFKLRRKQQ